MHGAKDAMRGCEPQMLCAPVNLRWLERQRSEECNRGADANCVARKSMNAEECNRGADANC
eukprot:5306671-Amphidinium_carterae.1